MAKKNSPQKKIVKALKSPRPPLGKRIHVISSGGKWVVRKHGASRASKVYASKKEALERARSIGKDSTIVVHNKDGSVDSMERVAG